MLLSCLIHLLLGSEHSSDKTQTLSLQLRSILKVEEAVVNQGQVKRLLLDRVWEFHQIVDEMHLHAEWCRPNQALLSRIEKHVEVSKDHLVNERRHIKVLVVDQHCLY